MLVRLDQTLHQHRSITRILQKLLHFLRQLLNLLTPDGVHAHSLSEEDKVRVRHLCVGVPSLVNDDVRILDGEIGIGGTVHAEHMEGAFRGLIEGTQALEGGSDRDVADF